MNTPPAVPDAATLKMEICTLSLEEFVSQRILDRTPWLFDNRNSYERWKRVMAIQLDVDPLNVLVVGSACLGRSLSPYKDFRQFLPSSDIDVAIVSSRHFDAAWRWLRQLGPADVWAKKSFEREMLDWHRRTLVFDGAIATDKLLPRLEFGPTWAMAFGRASNTSPIDGRDIKARIYRDFESLRTYHQQGVMKLRAGLQLPANAEETGALQIPTLDDT